MAQPPSEVQTTLTFQRRLLEAPDFDAFLEDNAAQMVTPRLCYYLAGLCRDKGRTAGQVIRLADLARTYGHQIFNGTRKLYLHQRLLCAYRAAKCCSARDSLSGERLQPQRVCAVHIHGRNGNKRLTI